MTGLNINKKTDVMKMNNTQETPLQLQGVSLLETDNFVHIGSIINKEGGADTEVKK